MLASSKRNLSNVLVTILRPREDPEEIKLDTDLHDDLDIDSIDGVWGYVWIIPLPGGSCICLRKRAAPCLFILQGLGVHSGDASCQIL